MVAFVLMMCAGCESDQVAVKSDKTGRTYGRAELITAVKLFTESDRSPADYRAMATAIAASAARFDEAVAAEAERNLVFLALGPLDAHHDKPLAEQMQALGVAVWPTALGVEPTQGETADAYAARICGAERAAECKYVIPEYRPLILGEYVWRRFHERAREAFNGCHECQGEASFATALATYKQRAGHMLAEASRQKDRAHPRRWPQAGDHAAPWSGVPLLAVSSEGLTLDGEAVSSGDVRKQLVARRERAGDVLGVFLSPSAKVRDLREILADAKAARYARLALQVRRVGYPYPLGEYRVRVGKGTRDHRVRVRNGDTIQVLIQALDAAIDRGVVDPWI